MQPELKKAIDYIKERIDIQARAALILGSGLGDFADTFDDSVRIATSDIPGYPRSTVEGHKGFLVFGRHKGVPLMAVQGRTHFYEGYEISRVSFVVEIIAGLGIPHLLVTNAAGSVNPRFKPGDLMLIDDHVNFLFDNPLRGSARFTDMSNPYSSELTSDIEQLALNRGIPLRRGVLWVSSGPAYESAAEVAMIRKMGGDAASMSTVPEVIMANTLGLKTVGISCLTNYATGISTEKLTHEEVTITAKKVKESFISLVSNIVTEIFTAQI
ncbi:MAG TPA: purine-nucleoside phosphorylase [Caldithrix abyssi]|uniref:Purine nucleoside phosphorylase n=1 Tax=Caldithrix abyssi TaxID=187145 RepID=A0A7V5RR24_CALAY|nr:purine-nucleoside phosphorylase [Caldithrix abyssi]